MERMKNIRFRVNWENDLARARIQQLENGKNATAKASEMMQSYDEIASKVPQESTADREREKNVHIYCVIVCIVLYLVAQRLLGFIYLCLRASRRVHSRLLRSVLDAPMGFFGRNDAGRILNRFSKDLYILDAVIPQSFYYTIYVRSHSKRSGGRKNCKTPSLPMQFICAVHRTHSLISLHSVFSSCSNRSAH